MPQKTFGLEVLNRRIEVEFYTGDDSDKIEYYPGTIVECKAAVSEDGSGAIKTTHSVQFDDGDFASYDDLDERVKGGSARWLSSSGGGGAHVIKKEEPKDNIPAVSPSKPAPKAKTQGQIKRKITSPPVEKEPSMKKSKLVPSSDDSSHSDDSIEIPASIDEIIRYMDRLEPDENYYERQADSRNGKFTV
jgi:hypothetical protein